MCVANMNTQEVISKATAHLAGLEGHEFDVLTVSKPVSPEAAINLSKVVSKLSPILGNLIEFNTVEFLNLLEDFKDLGKWKRQDPGFPDTILEGTVVPVPGFEIKAWFPLATEITARFRDSQNHFADDNTHVAMLAWIPEFIVFGKPRIIAVEVFSGLTVAQARDLHYHRPPDYLVLEPGDTSARTSNLQQTNTMGYKFQGTLDEFKEAEAVVKGWGDDGAKYLATPEYQELVRTLLSKFSYRLDTNFAKMDRIAHKSIEAFKKRVLALDVHGLTIAQWTRTLSSGNDDTIKIALEKHLGIKEGDVEDLVE